MKKTYRYSDLEISLADRRKADCIWNYTIIVILAAVLATIFIQAVIYTLGLVTVDETLVLKIIGIIIIISSIFSYHAEIIRVDVQKQFPKMSPKKYVTGVVAKRQAIGQIVGGIVLVLSHYWAHFVIGK